MAEAGCAGVLSGLEVDWGISVIASNLTTSSIAILASGQLAADVRRFKDDRCQEGVLNHPPALSPTVVVPHQAASLQRSPGA